MCLLFSPRSEPAGARFRYTRRVHAAKSESARDDSAVRARVARPDRVDQTTPGRLIALQRAAGNRATAEAVTQVQRKPDPKPKGQGKQAPSGLGSSSTKLFVTTDGWIGFEMNESGIRFLIAVGVGKTKAPEAAVPKLAAQIVADNAFIKQPGLKVTTCFIVPGVSTRYTFWGSQRVLLLATSKATVQTVAHEMGHAVFEDMMGVKGTTTTRPAPSASSVPAKVADLYLRLKETKQVPGVNKGELDSAGLLMVDPTRWMAKAKPTDVEHPWDDPDEFFGSAKSAYQVDRSGLERSIAKAAKMDSKIKPLGKELLALLDSVFGMGTASPDVPKERLLDAQKELLRVKRAPDVADSAHVRGLYLLLNPDERPKEK